MLPQAGVLLSDQLHGQGGVVVQQVEEAEPIKPQHFHRRSGEGVAAVAQLPPGDVLVAEQFTGAVAGFLALLAHQFDDAATDGVDRVGAGAAGENLGSCGKREGFTIHMNGHQVDG